MSATVINILSGYFSEELIEEKSLMRRNLHIGGPERVARVRAHFDDFLRGRPMTHEQFAGATMAWFPTDDELYAAVGDAYRFFFDDDAPVGQGR